MPLFLLGAIERGSACAFHFLYALWELPIDLLHGKLPGRSLF
jgi:hypothetical protein